MKEISGLSKPGSKAFTHASYEDHCWHWRGNILSCLCGAASLGTIPEPFRCCRCPNETNGPPYRQVYIPAEAQGRLNAYLKELG